MITRKIWTNEDIPALGMGCWAIGGPFFAGDAPCGWGEVDDAVSGRAIDAAVDLGVRFFDTAQAYGTGHSEEILGQALKAHPHVKIGTKVGYAIDSSTRQLVGEDYSAFALTASVHASLKRLRRDNIDLVHLHLNELAIEKAGEVFDCLATLRRQGKIAAFGWSTDFPDSAAAFAKTQGFVSIQHAMNVFFRAEKLIPVIEENGLLSINRSPLAMGLLSGKYDANSRFGSQDVRSNNAEWMDYFQDGRIKQAYAQRLSSIREILQSGGRTLVQGAICWLWSRSDRTLPIPGFRTPEQVAEICGALNFGSFSQSQMDEMERLIMRPPEGEPRSR